MYTRQLPLFFCLLAGTAFALDCYHGSLNDNSLMEGPCNSTATMCYKTSTVSSDGTLKETFGCDSGQLCTAASVTLFNCFNMTGQSSTTCCCNTMLCNPPSKVASMSGLPLMLIAAITLFYASA